MAGNIIPAIATANAIVAGTAVLRALRVLRGQWSACPAVFLRAKTNHRGHVLVPEKCMYTSYHMFCEWLDDHIRNSLIYTLIRLWRGGVELVFWNTRINTIVFLFGNFLGFNYEWLQYRLHTMEARRSKNLYWVCHLVVPLNNKYAIG